MNLLCVTMIEKTIADLINTAKRCQILDADLVEIRLDFLEEPISKFSLLKLIELKELIDQKLLLTIRPSWEGGKYIDEEKTRVDILKEAIKLEFDYIDVELKMAKEYHDLLVKNAKDSGIHTIVSYHDYQETPGWKEIISKMEACLNTGASIAKVVFNGRSYEDVLNIFQASKAAREKEYSFTIMGIGSYGPLTRFLGPFTGSKIIYACIEENKKAVEGQVEVNSLLKAWDLLDIHIHEPRSINHRL